MLNVQRKNTTNTSISTQLYQQKNIIAQSNHFNVKNTDVFLICMPHFLFYIHHITSNEYTLPSISVHVDLTTSVFISNIQCPLF